MGEVDGRYYREHVAEEHEGKGSISCAVLWDIYICCVAEKVMRFRSTREASRNKDGRNWVDGKSTMET